MPRLISCACTIDQIRFKSKTVTRRQGWRTLQEGEAANWATGGLFTISYLVFEIVGEDYIIKAPNPVPEESGLKELKMSEFHALKEAAESAKH